MRSCWLVHRHAPEQYRLAERPAADRSCRATKGRLICSRPSLPRHGAVSPHSIGSPPRWTIACGAWRGWVSATSTSSTIAIGRADSGGDARPLPHIVVVVEESHDLTSMARERVESAVQRLDKKGARPASTLSWRRSVRPPLPRRSRRPSRPGSLSGSLQLPAPACSRRLMPRSFVAMARCSTGAAAIA